MASNCSDPWVPEKGPPDLAFTNAKVVDVARGETLAAQTIQISRGRFAYISANVDVRSAGCGQIIDLGGKYLMPGLIDCHVHVTASPGQESVRDLYAAHPNTLAFRAAWNAKQMLLRGFTTVRDTAGADFSLRRAIADGLVIGPRMFICGKALSQTGGHGK